MSNQPPKHTSVQAPARPAGKDSHAGGTRDEHDDDALHVPRGVSRKTFYFLIGMMIFLMVIWLVPGAMFGIASGPTNPEAARFTLPSGTQVSWKASDLQSAQRRVNDALQVDFVLGIQLGIQGRNPDPAQVTRVLVLDRIAQDAGIEITNADLSKHLLDTLRLTGGTAEDFKNLVRANGFDQARIEESIRGLMRVVRFQQLLGFAGALPDPKEIEEQWHLENVEYAFDFATIEVESLKDQARMTMPDDAGLQAWFDKLDEGEKEEFKTGERRKAELALYRDSETTPATELLAAFPEKPPEGGQPTPAQDLASQYYNRVYSTRFAKPAPADASKDELPGFFTFEEVQERCLAEAPVYFALTRWIEDVNARRTNGETIDFTSEAQRYGLEHQAFDEPTREEYVAAAGLGEDVADAVFSTPPDGSMSALPIALAQGLAVVRVNERKEPELPPFETIRDKVAEKWLQPEAEKLALARLKSLREGLERFEPPVKEPKDPNALPPAKKTHYRATLDVFQASLEAAGLAPKKRDYLNKATRGVPPGDDEQRVLFHQATSFGLYDLEPDEVAEPKLGTDKKRGYLVRLAGKRDVPIENMTPAQYKGYQRTVRDRAVNEIGRALDIDYLKQNYGLWLLEDERKAEAAKKGS